MKFLADESLDAPIVARLRQDGRSVLYISEMSAGITDDEVLDRANQEFCVLITADKDFGELVFRLQRIAAGVILVRFSGLSTETKAEIVSQAIFKHSGELEGAFTVISATSIRIRKLP